MSTVACPTPAKRGYPTKSKANFERKRIAGVGRHHREAYECVCGLWHLATKLKHKRRRRSA